MKEWYQRLSSRDRHIVHAVGVAVLITLLYLLVVEPVRSGLQASRLQLEAQRELLVWMQQSAVQVKALRAAAGEQAVADDRPPYLLLDEAIKANGLPTPSRIEPQGAGTQAQFDAVEFDRLLVLLDQLVTRRGLQVTQASFTAKAAGQVAARITLERDDR